MYKFKKGSEMIMIDSIVGRYKESYVAFLDVLGFKDMVMKQNDNKLVTYFNEVNNVIDELKRIDRKKDIGYIVISDSIILTVEKVLDPEKNIKILRQICIAVSKIQKRLALNDIWIRGAISSGKTYLDQNNNQIVGPAYIDSYLLENELAIYPRVILDNRIFHDLAFDNSDDFIKHINRCENNEEKYVALYDWNKNVFATNRTIGQDLLFFIDYLENVVSDRSEFEIICNNIKKNIYSNTRISSKFRWVSNYLYTIALREEYKTMPYSDDFQKLLTKI